MHLYCQLNCILVGSEAVKFEHIKRHFHICNTIITSITFPSLFINILILYALNIMKSRDQDKYNLLFFHPILGHKRINLFLRITIWPTYKRTPLWRFGFTFLYSEYVATVVVVLTTGKDKIVVYFRTDRWDPFRDNNELLLRILRSTTALFACDELGSDANY